MKMVVLVFLVRAQVIIMQEREGFLSQDQEGEKRDPSSFQLQPSSSAIIYPLEAISCLPGRSLWWTLAKGMIDWLLSSPEENSDNVWIIWKLCAIYPPKTTFMVRTTASDPGFFERSICHDGNNLAFMYTREFAHSYPRSRPLFHARFDAGSAIFLLASTSRSRSSKTDLYTLFDFSFMIWYSQ